MRRRSALLPLCLALGLGVLAAPVIGQETTPGTTGTSGTTPGQAQGQQPAQKPTATEPQPLPYSEEEFAPWLHDLRRGEIVAIGSFPIVYLFTQLGYNLYRYGAHGWDSQYAPLGNPNQALYSESETIGVLVGAAVLSVGVAAVDYLIGRARERRAPRGAAGADP